MRSSAMIPLLVAVSLSLLLMSGCARKSLQAFTNRGSASPPEVAAYLDLTDGCTPKTEAFLQNASAEYDGEIDIQIHDMTEADETSPGLQTLAILFDGNHTVAWETDAGRLRVVRFTLPPGYHWHHADLEAALEAAAGGRLHKATDEDLQHLQKLPPKKIKITSQTFKKPGSPPVGQLFINGEMVVSLTEDANATPPGQRVNAASAKLKEWTAKRYFPDELTVKDSDETAALQVKGQTVLHATAADAKAAGAASPMELAEKWQQTMLRLMLCPGE
ncbi:MAG: hypothetical protein R6V19_06355 [Armatimonadota bacterium]